MRCRILHETGTRLRVRMMQYRMTPSQADLLEYYLRAVPGVDRVRVHERTMDAIIYFKKGMRGEIVDALASFDYETSHALVPEHTGRELQRQFEDCVFFLVVRRCVTRFLLPAPIRLVITAAKSVRYIARGIETLSHGKLEVPVLDAISITAAMLHGDFETAGSIMFLLDIGDLLEDWTHKKSIDDLAQRMYLNVDKVWMKSGGTEVLVPVNEVQPGDSIVVRAGNVIPLDGVVAGGEGSVNQASMTGESLPVLKASGGYVYAGTVMEEGELTVTVKNAMGSGRYDRIVRMIEDSEKLKSASASRAEHLADKLVPYSLGATALTYLLTRNVTKAMAILMVDYSCALKLAIPVSVISAMREAGDHHIDVKGGKFMEAVAEADTIVFDKTGTLTYATPRVAKIISLPGNDETEVLRLAACLEEHFPHSIANAVVAEAKSRGIRHEEKHSKVEYVVAHGIASSIDGERCVIGSRHFVLEDEACSVPECGMDALNCIPEECSALYLAVGGTLAAVLCIEDPVREEASEVIRELHKLGITKTVMMTGDGERTARAVAERIGIDEYRAEVLPEDKAAFIKAEHAAGRKVIMIGDGINDSPALSEADAGIAISAGAAIAREIADITISAEDLRELVELIRLSRALERRIRRNYRTIMSFNTFLIVMGVTGVMAPTTTALLHNVSTILIGTESMTDLLPA